MFKKININVPSLIATVIINVLISSALLVYATWTAPLSAPPACSAGDPGCDAPVNVGGAGQTKLGNLVIGGALGVNGIIQGSSDAYLAGNVGIGTTAPVKKVTVDVGNTAVSGGEGLVVAGRGTATPFIGVFNNAVEGGSIGLALRDGTFSDAALAGDTVVRSSSGDLHLIARRSGTGDIYFDTRAPLPPPFVGGGIDLTRMIIKNDGKVAIGGSVAIGTSTLPLSTLQVVGGYVQIPSETFVWSSPSVNGKPPDADCDSQEEKGRMRLSVVNRDLYGFGQPAIRDRADVWVCIGDYWTGSGGVNSLVHNPVGWFNLRLQ